ncbi:MAG TPA: Gfo/Idh/MocA family oxidoreductase [Isosphaeraceae bacterium]|nr:Gfo/Idh/MocA family oxidoreductase [Isosphaeraceae bacterium]
MDGGRTKLGILVVGAGFLGAQRAAAARLARGTRLVAVCDAVPAVAEAVASRHRVPAFADFALALKHPGVDAVVVATPHSDHDEQVRASLLAGKHVLCEKPLAIDPTTARDLASLAEASHLTLATGLNHRLLVPIRELIGLVRAGAMGKVESVRVAIGHRASMAFMQSWHTNRARSGGGTLIDNGPHACDLIWLLLGEVVGAFGYLRQGEGECEVEAFALFRGAGQATAELRSSWALETGYLTLEVRGREGYLRAGTAPWRLEGVLSDGRRIARSYLAKRVLERAFQRLLGCDATLVEELERFALNVAGYPVEAASGWDGCRASEMVAAVYRSARLGREVALRSDCPRDPETRFPTIREVAA